MEGAVEQGDFQIHHRISSQDTALGRLADAFFDCRDVFFRNCTTHNFIFKNNSTPALARLQRAREIGDSGLSLIATDPLLDPISKDPRFQRFVSDLGFA